MLPSHVLACATACSVEAAKIGVGGYELQPSARSTPDSLCSFDVGVATVCGLYVLILASAWPLLAKESERIYGLFARLFSRLRKKKPEEDVEEAEV